MDDRGSRSKDDQDYSRKTAQIREKVKRTELEISALRERISRLVEMTEHRRTELQFRTQELDSVQKSNKQESSESNRAVLTTDREAERAKLMEDLIKTHLHDTLLRYKKDAENYRKELEPIVELRPNTIIHTVKITYYNTTGGEATNESIRLATFRISGTTTLTDLKEEACKFWSINEKEMRLRSKNKEISEADLKQRVEQYVAKNAVPPEFSLSSSSFTGVESGNSTAAQEDKKQADVQHKLENITKQDQLDRTLDNFLGLKRYMPVPVFHSSTDASDRMVSTKSRDSSFCTLLFLLLVAFLSLYIILVRRNITEDYWHQQEVRNALEKNLSLSTKNFYKLVYLEDIYEYLKQIVAPAFFSLTIEDAAKGSSDYVGPVRLRQMRSKTVDCILKDDLDIDSYDCYYQSYDTESLSDDDINDGNQVWEIYKTADDNDIVSKIDGYLTDYDGSGFVFDAKPNLVTRDQFIAGIENLQALGWIDNYTRALAITANIYIRSADSWITVLVLFELHVTGVILPSKLIVSTFQPNMFERPKEKSAEGADICRLLFVLYFLYVYIMTVLEVKSDGRRNFGHIISFIGMIDLLMIFSVITAFGYSRSVNADSEEIYNSDDFTDMLNLSSNYSASFLWNALAFFFTCLRTLLLLRLNSRIHMIVNTIEMAAASMISYMIIFIPLLIGFCVVAMQTWGSSTFYYYQLDVALTSILVLTIGHVDYEFMLRVNEGWTIFFLIIYFFVMSFFLFGAFMGIYMDTYRLIRLRDGYFDDGNNWTKDQIKQWLLAWMPRRVTAILEKIKKKAGDL